MFLETSSNGVISHHLYSLLDISTLLLLLPLYLITMATVAKQLKDFLSSKSDFRIVYSSVANSPLANSSTRRIIVLDSSFNPPHLAHYTLAKEALKFKYSNVETPKSNSSLLLLLSVKNADKVLETPASYDHRLNMMLLMAHYLEKNLDVHVSIGLTHHAKFVDKSVSIIDYLKEYFSSDYHSMKLTFAVGFDTLVRILDPKYYLPDLLLDLLHEFMTTTDLFCLTRSENVESYREQIDYFRQLRHGKIAEIPKVWADNIHVMSVEEDRDGIGLVSSTRVRAAFASGITNNVPVIPEIREYIEENKLYVES